MGEELFFLFSVLPNLLRAGLTLILAKLAIKNFSPLCFRAKSQCIDELNTQTEFAVITNKEKPLNLKFVTNCFDAT